MAHGGDPLAFDDEVDDVRDLIVVITHHRHPIDRPIPITDFTVEPPDDPNRLGGWSGQHMDLSYVVATVLGS